ncbi:MAG: bifunctional adenosylcobinamide kinase/adenosylcobinamide-phosphate guanylyltransferase [Desulfobulbus sp.]|jgi:adenosylcobinamide kinase/adenosylcobinamide-phosphate guanylyltransferase|nr:MAG: bifunctional adenosylcobinamide kinase/adenosylcobinamide-phosphate guanylyltransferase [Desulfobulbus sp.]
MARITLISGGSRSGKSAFAQRLAEEQPGSRLFLATCPVTDPEMELRILRHVRDRQKGNWSTLEEQVDLAGQLRLAHRFDTVLIDCLTLWINNLMFEAAGGKKALDEDRVRAETEQVLTAAREHPGEVIMVTNEVGLGIVPDNPDARLYRDLIGRCNQCAGIAADRVYLVSCGIPIQIKGNSHAL